MGVVGYAGGHGAPFQAVAAHKPQADMPGVVMALQNRHFYDIPGNVYAVVFSLFRGDVFDDLLGEKFMRFQADDPEPLFQVLNDELFGPDDGKMEGIPNGGILRLRGREQLGAVPLGQRAGCCGTRLGRCAVRWRGSVCRSGGDTCCRLLLFDCVCNTAGDDFAVLRGQPAFDKYLLYVDSVQAAQNSQIGPETRGDGAAVFEAEALRGVVGAHLDCQNRIDSQLDRFADDGVHVALAQQFFGMAVVGDEEAAVMIRRLAERQQRLQVFGRRAFANHDPLAQAQLFQAFGGAAAFVVGAHSGEHVGAEIASR